MPMATQADDHYQTFTLLVSIWSLLELNLLSVCLQALVGLCSYKTNRQPGILAPIFNHRLAFNLGQRVAGAYYSYLRAKAGLYKK